LAISTPADLPRRRAGTLTWRERAWGLAFLAPWIAGFLMFFVIPMAMSFYWSFTDYNLVSGQPPQFVGLANWRRMLTDPVVYQSLAVTLRFLLISVPLFMAVPLTFALLVNARSLWGRQVFRTLFYMPYMVPLVAGAMIWRGVLNQQAGWVNRILEAFGVPAPGPAWLTSAELAVPTLTLIGLWGVGNTMMVMLAGLQNIPTELYEAAEIDGAGPLMRFRSVTLPLLSPVIFYNLVLAVIAGFQEFLRALIIYSDTNGAGPSNASFFYMVNLYREAFVYFNMGYASALAWGLFLVALAITAALFSTSNRWVYYAGQKDG
jgi:ABC-type sugar transport system permease subunit